MGPTRHEPFGKQIDRFVLVNVTDTTDSQLTGLSTQNMCPQHTPCAVRTASSRAARSRHAETQPGPAREEASDCLFLGHSSL